MAVLPVSDLQRILGENYRAKQDELDAASGIDDATRNAKARIDALQMRKSFILYVCAVGLVLTFASRFASNDRAMWIQIGIAMTVSVAAAAYYLYLRSEVSKGVPGIVKA